MLFVECIAELVDVLGKTNVRSVAVPGLAAPRHKGARHGQRLLVTKFRKILASPIPKSLTTLCALGARDVKMKLMLVRQPCGVGDGFHQRVNSVAAQSSLLQK